MMNSRCYVALLCIFLTFASITEAQTPVVRLTESFADIWRRGQRISNNYILVIEQSVDKDKGVLNIGRSAMADMQGVLEVFLISIKEAAIDSERLSLAEGASILNILQLLSCGECLIVERGGFFSLFLVRFDAAHLSSMRQISSVEQLSQEQKTERLEILSRIEPIMRRFDNVPYIDMYGNIVVFYSEGNAIVEELEAVGFLNLNSPNAEQVRSVLISYLIQAIDGVRAITDSGGQMSFVELVDRKLLMIRSLTNLYGFSRN